MALLSSGMSKGIFGAALLSVTFGAVASGRDLMQRDGIRPLNSSQLETAGTSATINRAAKADRAARASGSMVQTRTDTGPAGSCTVTQRPPADMADPGAR